MKVGVIIATVVLVIFLVIQVFAWKTQRNIETYSYKVIQQYDSFEVRQYDSSLFISVKLAPSDYKTASSKGFSILANYIFGGNQENKKVAMTSPVAMSMEDSMTMMFMVPKKYQKENAPTPNNADIKFQSEPVKKVAAIQFSGWADDQKINHYKSVLVAELKKEDIAFTNRFFFLGYNAPYELTNRRNEVIVELE